MPKKGNLAAFALSISSGLLLIISGIRGFTGDYGAILSVLVGLFEDAVIRSVLNVAGLILIFLASLGGFSVLLGGYLIYRSHVRLGKFIMSLGVGIGIPGLILSLLTIILTQEWSTIIAQYGIIGWTGIALSFIARAMAR